MSRKYKFAEKDGAYFVSFATINWIDVFTRDLYFSTITESLAYCRKEKGMELYGYCIMAKSYTFNFSPRSSKCSI